MINKDNLEFDFFLIYLINYSLLPQNSKRVRVVLICEGPNFMGG